MRILIRHADKEYDNGKSASLIHDPNITEAGRLQSRLLALRLLEMFGIPSVIICSPYRRARQTAIEMRSVIGFNLNIPIKIDLNLSEYLGNRTNERLDVEPDTLKFNPPHPENLFQLDNRIYYHNEMIAPLDYDSKPVWIITHGIVIQRLIRNLGYRVKRELPYLATFLIKYNSLTRTHNVSSLVEVEENSAACQLLPVRR